MAILKLNIASVDALHNEFRITQIFFKNRKFASVLLGVKNGEESGMIDDPLFRFLTSSIQI